MSALLALLGFSCGNDSVDEYGTPSATYKAKGVVVSEADDKPIQRIRAEIKNSIIITHTDSSGFFCLIYDGFPHQKLYVELSDVDGEENGSFAGMEIEADFTNATFTGGSGHWYEGEAEIDLGIIKMKPETKDENKPEDKDET
jgi:putative lipoprotein (rSAM/lipoprotein system)